MPILFLHSHYKYLWYKVSEEEAKNLFFPKLTVDDAKDLKKLRNYGRSNDGENLWFNPPHLLEYQERLKITVYCSFHFENYPFDFHKCELNLGSSSLSTSLVRLLPVKISHQKMTTSFGGKSILSTNSPEPFDIHLIGNKPFEKLENGYNFSLAGMEMHFYRNDLSSIICQFFVPTATFAIFSLVSYFIEPNMVPGRLALLVTLELISANVYIAVKHPESRGFSYIEIWIVGMQIPIFVGIFEYAFLLAMKRFQKPLKTKMIQVKQNKILDLNKPPISFDEISKRMDKWTLIFCLIYIILFSVIYWIVALNQIQSMINSLDE